jgi:hypothetical protein
VSDPAADDVVDDDVVDLHRADRQQEHHHDVPAEEPPADPEDDYLDYLDYVSPYEEPPYVPYMQPPPMPAFPYGTPAFGQPVAPTGEFEQLIGLLRDAGSQAAPAPDPGDLVRFRGQLVPLAELRRLGYIR